MFSVDEWVENVSSIFSSIFTSIFSYNHNIFYSPFFLGAIITWDSVVKVLASL